MKIFSTLLLIFVISTAYAQPITVTPALPTDADAVTIVFDATKATRSDLVGYTGEVYTHTGVKVEGNPDWQYVIGTWGNNTSQPKLTRTGTNTYQLTISPSIRQFYGVPADKKITQMCFVFRSADATKQTEDIFYNVYEQGLSVSITNPSQTKPIYELNDNISIQVSANSSTSLKLYIDNAEVASTNQTAISFPYTADTYGKHWIKAEASDGTTTKYDSVYILVRTPVDVATLPNGMRPGVNILNDNSVTIVLYDPPAKKNYTYLVGSFSDWLPDEQYYMKRTPDGKYHWLTLNGLEPNKEYAFQFLIDGYLRIADPFTNKTLDPNDQYIPSSVYPNLMAYPTGKTTGIASVFSTNPTTYSWQTATFTPPTKENLVIYELHIRDFVGDSYIQTVRDSLSYLKKLGVNAVELMPINEFEGNDSWGYNPSFYFATDKAYGKPNDYKEFIDEAHSLGMAVIIDMVLNHSFGQSPLVQMYSTSDGSTLGTPTADNPWYNTTCPHPPYCWGYDFNHESAETQKFVDSVLTYWLTEYKVDGFRFDFTKGFTNTPNAGSAYDATRIAILKRIADKIWSVNPNAYIILEHFCDNTEEKALAEYRSSEGKGMLIWGNMNYAYGEATMGWVSTSDISWVAAKQRGWSVPHVIGYMESHDEERLMYKNLQYGNASNSDHNVKTLPIALMRMQTAANLFIPFPGPKMIWQFGELGYDVSIDYNGRLGRKPLHWEYYQDDNRREIFNTFAHLNRLKQQYEVFKTDNYDYNLSGAIKWLKLNSSAMDVVIAGNFDVNQKSTTITFNNTGWWYEYYSGDSVQLSTTSYQLTLNPAEYRMFTSERIKRNDIYVGINQPKSSKAEIMVWPNPASGNIFIKYFQPSNSHVKVDMYNLTGQLVYSETRHNFSGENTIGINIPNELPRGLYILRISSNGFVNSSKVAIEH
ncbi:MAG TPA: alpha-amylase family glycosyl hydrolase [Tenuifilum sp.]|nr:alpha-amylase family glycosyl hydrolase [Tenuifilum sp.]